MSSIKHIQGESGGDSGPDPSTGTPTNASKRISSRLFRASSPTPTEDVNLYIDVPEDPHRNRLLQRPVRDYCGAERYRLEADRKKEVHWKKWGPYLSDRQWGTVREDYSHDGDTWNHFPHEHARSRAYRWGEDGIAGISDNHQRLCLALSLWNDKDHILKERLFGVSSHQGNHGEDVKELYWYLDSTPTHSYMKFLYKYPQRAFPYEQLVQENQTRGRDVPEFEILDTDAFDDNRYWDVFVEYAKDEKNASDIYVRIVAYNRGPDPATLHILPQFWFPNTWSWSESKQPPPQMSAHGNCIIANHHSLGTYHLYCLTSPPPVGPDNFDDIDDADSVEPELIFTENNTNFYRLYCGRNKTCYVKDGFHDHIIPSHSSQHRDIFKTDTHLQQMAHGNSSDEEQGHRTASPHGPTFVNPAQKGTKSAAHYIFKDVPPNGGCSAVRLRLTQIPPSDNNPTIDDEEHFDDVIEERRQEADEFYGSLMMGPMTDDLVSITRQALGGMLWTKQHYQFIQKEWLRGDPLQPPPPPEREYIRNRDWSHMRAADILSIPDKWEYPFFATWDTAFHCIPLALVDPAFAKKQLEVLTRELYMKPDGQIPANEWNFGDVNPPVHAWAAFRVFKIERKSYGREDIRFLECAFQRLYLNFTWWLNRKDENGKNVFESGFLGLDKIGVFNRYEPPPAGGTLRQADGTAWMAFYCLNMLSIALELAKHNPVYEDIASQFFEHFIFIADAMIYKVGENEQSLWNDQDGMYYDVIQFSSGNSMHLPVHSLVGLIPLFATLVLESGTINRVPGFKKRMEWFIDNRPEVSARNMANMRVPGKGERRLLALADKDRLIKILEKVLDEDEFFGDHGIRSLSKIHKYQPCCMDVHGSRHEVGYWPGDSMLGTSGGNSNWRGPVWLSVNFLLIESLQRFYQYYGDDVQVECPTGSGEYLNLVQVAEEIQHRITHIFGRDFDGRRSTNGGNDLLDRDPYFRDYVWFHEYFHSEDGRGLGASHQTGCSGLVAYHIIQSGVTCRLAKTPKTPRSLAYHYFDEAVDSLVEGDELLRAFRVEKMNALGDLSPDAL